MAFTFARSDRSLERGARRIGREQVGRALSQIDAPAVPPPVAVHEVRKAVKRLRALLRLLRPGLSDHASLDMLLRDAARHVAALRDADVLLHTLETLSPGGLPALRAALHARRDAGGADTDAALAACRATLTEAAPMLRGLSLTGSSDDVLHAGLSVTLRRAQSANRIALRADSAVALHDFRKRVKDHLYHARLLTPLWPELMHPHAEAAELLSETLGKMNDIAVFVEALAPLHLPDDERAAALALAHLRHDRLALTALPLGARLFAGRPEDLADRWCALWAIWMAEA